MPLASCVAQILSGDLGTHDWLEHVSWGTVDGEPAIFLVCTGKPDLNLIRRVIDSPGEFMGMGVYIVDVVKRRRVCEPSVN